MTKILLCATALSIEIFKNSSNIKAFLILRRYCYTTSTPMSFDVTKNMKSMSRL